MRYSSVRGGITLSTTDWFIRPQPKLAPSTRLICLPYAGGSAATYVPWSRLLPPEVELIALQPPGRGSRMAQPPHSQMQPLVSELMSVFQKVTDRPYVIFGHSLGSRVGFELMLQCQMKGIAASGALHRLGQPGTAPVKAGAAHTRPAGCEVCRGAARPGWHARGGLNNSELIQWLLPLLRADFRIADTHRSSRTALNCPLTVLGGTEDETVSATEIEAWRDVAASECDIHWVNGGHFFVERNREWVLERVNAVLAGVIASRSTRLHS